jgi:hypothetical protein
MRALAAVLAVPVFVAVAVTLFAWPQAGAHPRGLPLGVVGSVDAAPAALRKPGAFELHRYATVAAASDGIRDRDVYAAIAPGRAGPTLLEASAAGPQVAQLLRMALAPRRVVDLVPATAKDPRGVAIGLCVLPLALAGVATAALIGLTIPAGVGRVAALVAACALAGLAAVAVVQGWLDVVRGGWVANAGAMALTVMAVAAVGVGLLGLIGRVALPLTAFLAVMLGNAFSGVTTAPELLPGAARTVGQLMPPGAGGQLLRSTAFFDGARAASHLVVLAAWTLVGLVMIVLGVRRTRSLGSPR